MSRLAGRFAALKVSGERALICYITAGDPSEERTVEIADAIVRAGADAIEIGIPFSDPLADGPSIQAASQRALTAGMTAAKALKIVQRVRQIHPDIPLIVMTYFNPIRRYGLERYAQDACDAGVDGHIVTDLTPEEADSWQNISHALGMDTIYLLAPTSTSERIRFVSRLSTGFLYCVSRTGVTGARQDVPMELEDLIVRIQSFANLPICVGFGISTPEHVKHISALADGAVVGSALVDLIHTHSDAPDLLERVGSYVASLKAATKLQSA